MPIPTRGQNPYDYDPRYHPGNDPRHTSNDPRHHSNDLRYHSDPRHPSTSHDTNGIDRHMMNGYPPGQAANGAGRAAAYGPGRAAHVPKPTQAAAAVADPYRDMYADPHLMRSKREQQGVATQTYLVEHLCTFTMDRKEGLVTVEDAIRKLKRMDAKGKVWSQDVLLRVTDREIQIVDEMTQGELENFNLTDITLLSAEENQCNYNNVLVIKFRLSSQKNPQMYLFQCDRKSCKEIANDLQVAVDQANGRRKRGSRQQDYPAAAADPRRMGGGIPPGQDRGLYIPPPPDEPPPNPPAEGNVRNKVAAFAAAAAAAQASGAAISPRGFQSPKSNPVRTTETEEPLELIALRTEKDVQILNHCFDDVEAFIGQLQKAAEAYTELARRRKSRKNRQKKEPGDGLLLARSRPPPESAYIECFQKFKYCFNLLAKLKAHIHDPNAPELVHFLFVPLELIIQSCQGSDLAASVVSPLLTYQGVELLRNCLTSRENELWLSLGQTWTVPESEWPKDRPTPPRYVPTFRDGWIPPHVPDRPLSTDVGAAVAASAAVAANAAAVARGDSGRRQDYADIGFPRHDSLPSSGPPSDTSSNSREPPPPQVKPKPVPIQAPNPTAAANYPPPPTSPPPPQPVQSEPRPGVKARYVKVKYDFVARNRKELTTMDGETLEVLDDRRKWWWVRNSSGQAGYVPYTILDHPDQVQSTTEAQVHLPQHQQRNPNFNTNHQAPSPPSQSPMTSPTFPGNEQYQKAVNLPQPPPPAPPPPPPVEPPNGGMDLATQIQNTVKRKQQEKKAAQQNQQQNPAPHKSSTLPRPEKKQMDLHEELLKRVSQPAQKRNFRVVKQSNGPTVHLTYDSEPDDVVKWLQSKGFNKLTVDSLGVLTGAQLFSLTKEELVQVSHEDGARVYSQLQVQKSYIEQETKEGSSELAAIMERRKVRSDSDDSNNFNNGAVLNSPPDFNPASPPALTGEGAPSW